MERQQEFVLRTLEERDIRFVRLWFTDVLGFLKSVAVAPAELEQAFAEGIGFDGSAIEGFARVHESDMLVKPDPSTFQIISSFPVPRRRKCCGWSKGSKNTTTFKKFPPTSTSTKRKCRRSWPRSNSREIIARPQRHGMLCRYTQRTLETHLDGFLPRAF